MTKQVRWSAAAESSWDLPSMKARPTRPTGGLPHGANRLKTSNDERRGVQPLRFDEAVPAPDLRFQKGVRSLVLCTMCRTCASLLSSGWKGLGIAYRIQSGDRPAKVNLCQQPRDVWRPWRHSVHKAAQQTLRRGEVSSPARYNYDVAGRCERYCRRRVSGCFIRTTAVN